MPSEPKMCAASKWMDGRETCASYRDTAYVSLPQWRDLMQAITALLDGRTTT